MRHFLDDVVEGYVTRCHAEATPSSGTWTSVDGPAHAVPIALTVEELVEEVFGDVGG
jgi:hypothetical protein